MPTATRQPLGGTSLIWEQADCHVRYLWIYQPRPVAGGAGYRGTDESSASCTVARMTMEFMSVETWQWGIDDFRLST